MYSVVQQVSPRHKTTLGKMGGGLHGFPVGANFGLHDNLVVCILEAQGPRVSGFSQDFDFVAFLESLRGKDTNGQIVSEGGGDPPTEGRAYSFQGDSTSIPPSGPGHLGDAIRPRGRVLRMTNVI